MENQNATQTQSNQKSFRVFVEPRAYLIRSNMKNKLIRSSKTFLTKLLLIFKSGNAKSSSMKKTVIVLFFLSTISAFADGADINAKISKDEQGKLEIEIQNLGEAVTNVIYHTDLAVIPDTLASKYFFLSMGKVISPASLPAGCQVFPYGQSAHSPGATQMDFYLTLQGKTCANAVDAFTSQEVKIMFNGVMSGTGEQLGDLSVDIK